MGSRRTRRVPAPSSPSPLPLPQSLPHAATRAPINRSRTCTLHHQLLCFPACWIHEQSPVCFWVEHNNGAAFFCCILHELICFSLPFCLHHLPCTHAQQNGAARALLDAVSVPRELPRRRCSDQSRRRAIARLQVGVRRPCRRARLLDGGLRPLFRQVAWHHLPEAFAADVAVAVVVTSSRPSRCSRRPPPRRGCWSRRRARWPPYALVP